MWCQNKESLHLFVQLLRFAFLGISTRDFYGVGCAYVWGRQRVKLAETKDKTILGSGSGLELGT